MGWLLRHSGLGYILWVGFCSRLWVGICNILRGAHDYILQLLTKLELVLREPQEGWNICLSRQHQFAESHLSQHDMHCTLNSISSFTTHPFCFGLPLLTPFAVAYT